MNRAVIVGTVALAVFAAPLFAGAQTAPTAPAAAEKTFVIDTANVSMAEVELGKLAAEKATTEPVKQFAQRMVTDHSKANDELKSLAQTKNITLPAEVDAAHKAVKARLEKLSGDAFDRAYMEEMVAGHRKAVNAVRTESKSGKDAEIKAWAAKTLPTLEEHLKLAQDANKAVGTSGKK